MTAIETLEVKLVVGRTVVLDGNDIDTDRIIPARFLKHLTFKDLGNHVFEDDRKQLHSLGEVHPLDDERHIGASILLTAKNFGCGSSREHAPQALHRWGIRAIVGESFGEIFRGNCGTIGLPCVVLRPEDATAARAFGTIHPEAAAQVDLEQSVFRLGAAEWPIEMSESLREAFIAGRWDTLSELLSAAEQTRAYAETLPYLSRFPVLTAGGTELD